MGEDTRLHRLYNRARLDDREVNELIGLAHGVIADGIVIADEVHFLQKWLVAHTAATGNPVVRLLLERIDTILSDGVVEPEEAADVLFTLRRFAAGDFELGETIKSASLFLDEPPPSIAFRGSRFCFTGTFAFGTRKECETAVSQKGGVSGSLTSQTNYLIVGSYATESWIHSAFGRKIEKAVAMREQGLPIGIIAEPHWVEQL